ncbi:MAG: Ribonuclease PH [candidate division TM6 bacterium GW2011_GWF2_30_66]|jgi:ribonuclease PH|nr:MAG: Ribonuclease PH [candidate division TM6 bacterium GW2011_GWF2_30_66]
MNGIRKDGRSPQNLREIKVEFNTFGYAAGSVLFEVGNTKVLCSVSLQVGVPKFLKGQKKGWLTAEYSMLPMSSQQRIEREATVMRKNGRSVEISRLIGRSLRTIIDFDLLGERTIYIDCDVLQADGGTRTACITGACLALRTAVDFWLRNKIIRETIIKDSLASISVGVVDGLAVLDLSYEEDSRADADFNFVITKSNKIVEIQGASEGNFVSWEQFEQAKELACSGIKELLKVGDNIFEHNFGKSKDSSDLDKLNELGNQDNNKNFKAPLFSLGNRQNIQS